jgi:alcohol dehydrogenase class IV
VAAEKSCEVLDEFMQQIGMWLSFEGLGVSQEELVLIADHSQVLPDYENNPRVATRDEIHDMLMSSYQRN